MTAYYNEIEPYAAQWLRNLAAVGLIPAGDVDERSITDVQPDDLRGYTQCHFFAGIAGWGYALRLAGWPDDREVWTGSCPCQPFSVAGKRAGADDARHLWPDFFRLISTRRPAVVMGEQVAAAVGKYWLDRVCADLESVGYACGAAVVPACAVNAPHRRDRLWFVADSDSNRRKEGSATAEALGYRDSLEPTCGNAVADSDSGNEHWWSGPLQVGRNCIEGKAKTGGAGATQWRIKPGLPLLAHGISGRLGRLRAYGNAIVPQVAAEVIASYMEYAA